MLAVHMLNPLPVYLDESAGAETLAPRLRSLEGKVVGLLPNWRPSAVDLLNAVGAVIQERYAPKAVIMEQPTREVPVKKGRLLDGMEAQLDNLARRVDAVITASGD
jgi:hypothetical protein